jgi:hypothetical protein
VKNSNEYNCSENKNSVYFGLNFNAPPSQAALLEKNRKTTFVLAKW